MTRITAIDFETANYRSHSAIAVGLTVIEDRRIVESVAYLIRPPENWFVPKFIDIHGIHPHMVQDAPSFEELWSRIGHYFLDTTMLAHNAGFDRGVLEGTAAYYELALPKLDWLCTVQISRKRWPELERHKLNIVCDHLGIELNHHDAGSDALAAAKIYLAA
ncbi:MAG: polymerase [Micavibrio sp.]|nr:polymerase [Micavibrio sp.]